MESSKILLKDGRTVDLVDGRIADGDIASWNNKLNKVSGATEGDVATLDANGNLVDSGVNFNPSTNTMSVNISGKASSADSASATTSGSIQANDDLNSYNAANRNYICNADKASTVSNKPSGASGAFELEVIRGTGDTCVQVYYSRDDVNFNYIRKRTGINNAWTDWVKLNDSTHTHTVKINGVTKTISATGGAAVDLGTYLTNHQAVSDSNPTLAWGTTSTVGTVGGKALRVTMPSNPASGMAEDFFATVTQSTFEDVKAAYNAGKRIVGVLGGTISGGNPFRQETPLAFVVFSDNEPFSFIFLFENARPKTESGDGLGSTNRWTLSSSGWATSTDNVDYAETAGTANTSQTANKLSTVDTAPKKGSSNMVTSDGLWNNTTSPIAYYFATTGTIGIYNGSSRADEVVIRNCGRFRLTTSWLKNFSGRTFKIHNAMSANLEISVQVEAGLKLLLTDELNSSVKTFDNTSGSSSAETRRVLSLLPGETLRLYVIYTSGTTDVALFIIGSGRWSVFSPTYDRYRRVESISYYQRLCCAKTTGSPGSKGNVHLYDGKNWHNLCNITDDPGIVRIAGLDSSRTSSNPATSTNFDGYMNIVTGLTLTRNGYMGMLHGYVAPKQSIAFRLPTASSDTAESYTQSGKTLANCSELRIDGFDKDAVGAGHAVFTASSLLHITLLSGTLTFAIAGDFSVFTTGASYFFSIPLSFGNLTA